MVLCKLYGFEPGQMSFYVSRTEYMNETFVYDNSEMKNSKKEKILGVISDNKFRFKRHVKNLCKHTLQAPQ